jgi:FKBP-type peptidyl-prolyl cis-trans isomerase 2
MKVDRGSLVWLDYDAFLDSGELIDASATHGPLCIRVGGWQVLPGLGEKLLGLAEGDERLIRLAPAEAFGEWDPNSVLTMRLSRLVGDAPLEDGMTLLIQVAGGPSAVCRVYRIMMEDRIALDFNHPHAGEPLTLFVRVRKVAPPARRRLAVVR